ncbi:MAG: phage minor capsid protein [Roseburia inulinivorans]
MGGKTYTYYESTQKQRQMERQIRATKREIEATKSIGGDAQDLQNKLRGQMADYKSFSRAAGLKERDNRLRVESGSSYSEIYKGISECC